MALFALKHSYAANAPKPDLQSWTVVVVNNNSLLMVPDTGSYLFLRMVGEIVKPTVCLMHEYLLLFTYQFRMYSTIQTYHSTESKLQHVQY